MTLIKENYDVKKIGDKLWFEKIKYKHRELIKDFESYQGELKNFLIEDALISQEISISNTYLVFDKCNYIKYKKKKENLILLGYITISNDSINLDASLKQQFKEKGVLYKSLPALKIGRLCIDNKYQKKNLGTCLLVWAAKRAAHLNQSTACRFITLNAKRHIQKEKDSYHFYKKYGFKILKKRGNKTKLDIIKQKTGSTPMYLDMLKIIKKISNKQGESDFPKEI